MTIAIDTKAPPRSIPQRAKSLLIAEIDRRRCPPSVRRVTRLVLLCDVAGTLAAMACMRGIASPSILLLAAIAAATVGAILLLDAAHIDLRESPSRQTLRTIAAMLLATAAAYGLVAGTGSWVDLGSGMDPVTTICLMAAALAWSLATRAGVRIWVRKTADQAQWLLIGRRDSEGLGDFWREYRLRGEHGRITFLADLRARPRKVQDASNRIQRLPTVAGDWSGVEARLAERWSGIILAEDDVSADVVRAITRARLAGLPVMDLEDFYDQRWKRVPVGLLKEQWFATSQGFHLLHQPQQQVVKRILDIVLASGLLLVAAPVMLVVAAVVAATSRGPILYRQPRTGHGGRPFTCLKFRTMVADADRGDRYTGANDSRITRPGRLLRRSRLDELPQLFNILRGDMSFIGPRAEWTELVSGYELTIPYYQVRHVVRPGLTGWAQVNYPYGASVEDARIKLEYDMWYIKNHSPLLDLWIVARTIRVVLFGIGSR